jgi:hypothetical protein
MLMEKLIETDALMQMKNKVEELFFKRNFTCDE